MDNVSPVNNSGRIVVGFKGGGNAGEALIAAPGEAIEIVAHGGTPLAIERLGDKLAALHAGSGLQSHQKLNIDLISSLAAVISADGKELTVTDGFARTFTGLGIHQVKNIEGQMVAPKAGISIRLDEIFNAYLRSKQLPEIEIESALIRNDTEMVGLAATKEIVVKPKNLDSQVRAVMGLANKPLIPLYDDAIILTASTSGNIVEPGKGNMETGQASMLKLTEAATGEKYSPFFRLMDSLARFEFESPLSSTLTGIEHGGNKNPLKLIIGSGKSGSAMKLEHIEPRRYKNLTGEYRGAQVHAIAAIKAVKEGGKAKELVLTGLGLSEDTVKQSPLYRKATHEGIKNEDITHYDLEGDKFAKAIMKYQAIRMAHAVVGTHNLLHRSDDKPAPKIVLAQGGYVQHVFFKGGKLADGPTDAQQAFIDTYRELTSIEPSIRFFNPPHDGVKALMEERLGSSASV